MPRILVVEDSEDIRNMITTVLSSRYTVLEARNGKEAWELFESYSPALIITDLIMPAMSGFELVRKIRAINSDVKILVISALSNRPGEQALMLKVGVNGFLAKPFAPENLEKCIANLLTLP